MTGIRTHDRELQVRHSNHYTTEQPKCDVIVTTAWLAYSKTTTKA